MSALFNQTITAALTAFTAPALVVRDPSPGSIILQGTFTYGSGGTTADVWVQTSIDDGATWTDVANFHFTTASARFLYNLSAYTSITAEYTPTDGTLAANTSKDGLVGALWRAKVTTTGVYAGGTILRVDAFCQARLTLR